MTQTTELDRIKMIVELAKTNPNSYDGNLNAYIFPAILELAERIRRLEEYQRVGF